MGEDCIFCRIVSSKLPVTIEYQDKFTVAFRDIHPKALFHMLIVPKKHILNIETTDDTEILGKVVIAVGEVIKKFAIKDYKIEINGGKLQEVKHLHVHLMSEGGV